MSVVVGEITQVSGSTSNDFSNSSTTPLIYVVTAADGSTKDYSVTVIAAANPAKDITAFAINGVSGVINNTNIGSFEFCVGMVENCT